VPPAKHSTGRSELLGRRDDLDRDLRARLVIGEDRLGSLLPRSSADPDTLRELRDRFETWDEYNHELLLSAFTTSVKRMPTPKAG
jgi:hypothetical protein